MRKLKLVEVDVYHRLQTEDPRISRGRDIAWLSQYDPEQYGDRFPPKPEEYELVCRIKVPEDDPLNRVFWHNVDAYGIIQEKNLNLWKKACRHRVSPVTGEDLGAPEQPMVIGDVACWDNDGNRICNMVKMAGSAEFGGKNAFPKEVYDPKVPLDPVKFGVW